MTLRLWILDRIAGLFGVPIEMDGIGHGAPDRRPCDP
jgi:hypothetical protein